MSILADKLNEYKGNKYFPILFDTKRLNNADDIVLWDMNVSNSIKQLQHVDDSFSVLWPDKYSSVALVGNSGCLSTSTYGSDIDSHDCVIRFNTAPVIGFEDNVGSKTTIRIFTGKNHFYGDKSTDILYIKNYQKDTEVQMDIRNKTTNFHVMNNEFCNYIRSFKPSNNIPSTGFIGVCLAIILSSGHISMYGFDLPKDDEKYHYYDYTKYREAAHTFSEEHAFYTELNEQVEHFTMYK